MSFICFQQLLTFVEFSFAADKLRWARVFYTNHRANQIRFKGVSCHFSRLIKECFNDLQNSQCQLIPTRYSQPKEIQRARTHFQQGKRPFLLFTERFYFFYRYTDVKSRSIKISLCSHFVVFFTERENKRRDCFSIEGREAKTYLKHGFLIFSFSVSSHFLFHPFASFIKL